jgi:hypothetical protein
MNLGDNRLGSDPFWFRGTPDLDPVPDRHHAESICGLLAVPDPVPISRLEHVERQGHVRKEHHTEREEG